MNTSRSLLNKCWDFATGYILDDSKPDIVKSELVRRVFKLNRNVKSVLLQITTKDGISTKRISIRHNRSEYPELIVWRKKIYERDDYTCQRCKKKGGRLEAHHIKGWADYPEARFDLNNGVTLCKKCHAKTGNYGKCYNQFDTKELSF